METAGLIAEVTGFLGRLQLEQEGTVIAVSGGPDSMALTRVLMAVRPTQGAGPLILAHLNHQLRGQESVADEDFVREQSRVLGLPFRCERLDVAGLARAEGGNLEAVARRLRYDWLAQVARQEGIRQVATGHSADDQAETVLHRLLRGSGVRGLRGILCRRTLAGGIDVIRPLLSVTRAAILCYLENLGQTYRQDSSNLDARFTRNRIRQDLLPLLVRSYNPAVVEVLARLARQAADVYGLQEIEALALLARAERPRAGGLLVFARGVLAGAPRHLVREALRRVWTREGWPLDGMSFQGWERLTAVAVGESTAADCPGGIRARCRERVVQIGRA